MERVYARTDPGLGVKRGNFIVNYMQWLRLLALLLSRQSFLLLLLLLFFFNVCVVSFVGKDKIILFKVF